jgi:hypothetical protein
MPAVEEQQLQWDQHNDKDNSKITRTKEQYEVDNQRQINRALRAIVEQLNSTFLQSQKEETERFTFFSN